jgi:hypothetical protein
VKHRNEIEILLIASSTGASYSSSQATLASSAHSSATSISITSAILSNVPNVDELSIVHILRGDILKFVDGCQFFWQIIGYFLGHPDVPTVKEVSNDQICLFQGVVVRTLTQLIYNSNFGGYKVRRHLKYFHKLSWVKYTTEILWPAPHSSTLCLRRRPRKNIRSPGRYLRRRFSS